MARMTVAEKLLLDAVFEIATQFCAKLEGLRLSRTVTLLRKRLRMSQRTLAKRARISQATLSKIETGQIEPSLSTLIKIFNSLYCDIAILPIPRQNLDELVKQRVRHIAEKRVRYLKGTMALELQQPEDAVLNELVLREEQQLYSSENLDIWREEGKPHAHED